MKKASELFEGENSSLRKAFNNATERELTKCCIGLAKMGQCGRGKWEGCNGEHCRCMEKDCSNMHYVDCYEHYIHVEFIPPPRRIK